jgi:hypoxanthine phosphoribosyltransferase
MTTGEKTTRPEGGPAPPPFAHPSEAEFARILDFYGVRWLYEPHSFPIRWEGGEVVEM